MATNKIYFNNTTAPITLNGIYWNGTKIEGCKGIKLNGDIVVSFETAVSHLLKWSDYTNAYNAVWINGDTSGKMAKMTAENEFAVVRSRWMLYNRRGLFDTAGISDYRLFNFNSDGRIYVKDAELVDNWTGMHDMMPNDGTGVITIAAAPNADSVNGYLLAYHHLTGLPLVFKTDEGAFQATTILDGNLGNITKQEDAYRIILGDPQNTIDYMGNAITATDIKDAIERQLGITATIQEADTAIDLGDTTDWGEFELLDALSNVYVQGFGPYGAITDYSDGVYPDHPNAMYYLEPNMNFTPQEYWNVPNESKIPIEIKYWDYYDTMGCDFYILTAWGNNVIGNPAVGDTVDLAGSYYAQGDGNDGKPENEYVNITYFDISSFAGTQYPNFLCSLNMVFSNFVPSTIYESGDITIPKWIGVNTGSGLIGSSLTSTIFPSGCPYDITSGGEPSVDDITVNKWKTANNISMECNFAIDQTYEMDYLNESLAPNDIAADLLADYVREFPEKFEQSSSATAKKFPLKLKMRSYPSYATGNGATGAPEFKWYLNAWDPLNAAGYYPVKKTKRDVAGSRFNTYVNYTAQ